MTPSLHKSCTNKTFTDSKQRVVVILQSTDTVLHTCNKKVESILCCLQQSWGLYNVQANTSLAKTNNIIAALVENRDILQNTQSFLFIDMCSGM